MPRGKKSSEPLTTISVKIKRSSHEALQNLYPRTGYSQVIRRLVEAHIESRMNKEVANVIGTISADSDPQGAV